MCGIIGVVSSVPIADRGWLGGGRDAMRHRGPDGEGEWWSPDGCVGLAHRRLAIIDLSPAGHQPMQDSSGELSIVFNGEIYNFLELRQELQRHGHEFKSHSDTEVILQAYRKWGVECLSRLNGMFAFAIYDSPRRKLFIARDRAGEKPLYYSLAGGALRFASELKGLLVDRALSRRIDSQALDCYLSMGFVPGELCMLQGFKKLPPGHALSFTLSDSRLAVWRYWALPEPRPFDGNEQELLGELETVLEDSVRRQLIADVPVGVLLSGGVDSSLVTAMAVRAKSKVKTFTVRFPGHRLYDETEHARFIAKHFGTEHVELEAEQSSVDVLPVLARQFDEPIVDSSIIPTFLVSRLVRQHCTVALGGDGGDELFGGYVHYNRLLWMQERLGWIPRNIRVAVSRAAEALLPVGFKGRNWLQGLEVEFNRGLPLIASYFDRRTRGHLIADARDWKLAGERIREQNIPQIDGLLQRATRMDFNYYLPEDILVKVDRASMLNSLEVRAPLLDYRLIEFAFAKVPDQLKASAVGRKLLLKKLTERVLPTGFDRHRKQGFSIPLASWLQSGAWRAYFRDVLTDASATFFDRKTVHELLRGQDKGRANSERLFALLMFELWRREYGCT